MKVALTTKDGRRRLLLGDQGKWLAEIDGKCVALDQRRQFRDLLPLLEEDPQGAADRWSAAVPSPLLSAFPLDELLLHALEEASSYWKRLALGWLEIKPQWSDEIRDYLVSLAASEPRWPQALRHRAQALLRSRVGNVPRER